MRSASAGLIALLNSGQKFFIAELYTITLTSGTVLRYANWDVDIVFGGNTYAAGSLKFQRSQIRTVLGVEVDTMDLTVYGNDGLTSLPFLRSCANGQMDKAVIRLDRLVMPTISDSSNGTLLMFLGTTADIQAGRSQAQLTIKSYLELLNVKLPRTLYQPACWHTLYDGGCTLAQGSFSVTSSANAGSTTSSILCGLAQAAGYFDLGKVTFTSGVNLGLTRAVRSYTPGVLTLMPPLPAAPGTGDTFTATPGCDKQQATCNSKFNNLVNFGGFPYVPPPETAA